MSESPKLAEPMDEDDCKACPASIWNDWRLRGLKVRSELRRHKIKDTEMRVVEVILDKSFGWGRPCLVVPQLKMFAALTGMAEPHIHKAITGLHLKRIIRVVMVKGLATYCVREDSENWKVEPRASRETIRETISLLRELNELPPLPRIQEELPNFNSHADAEKIGAQLTEKVITEIITSEKLPTLH